MIIIILLTAIIPLIGAIIINVFKFNKKIAGLISLLSTFIPLLLNILIAVFKTNDTYELFRISSQLVILNKVDFISLFFSILISFVFFLVSIYSLEYFKHDERKNKFDLFYLLSLSALMLLCYSGNLVTMYISFEYVTLCSMPLVFHDKTKESVDAAMKYLIYSVAGAFLGLVGIMYLSLNNVASSNFVLGGSLNSDVNMNVLCAIMLITVIGFGAKAGMFPMHNWLPTAHPVAPAPASAVLSGIITKSGVIALIRIIYYVVGADKLYGTWFQIVWIILILLTILLGSFMAVIQRNLKKRLAFSSISQISYALLGIAMMNTEAITGTLLQVSSHAIIKVCLFLFAGIMIHVLDKHYVDEMEGVGKIMPISVWCFTIASLGLIGIPPTSGFVAKWYLAIGSINSALPVLYIIAPICLIISAILTAAYLLTPAIHAFFPKDHDKEYKKIKEPILTTVVLVVLATITVLLGIFSNSIIGLVSSNL